MKIIGISVKPEKKTADVWDAVTETEVKNSTTKDKAVRLKTYILNEKNNSVGKTETDFTVKAGSDVLAVQSVLTYSPVMNEPVYTMICELYHGEALADKSSHTFKFTV